MATPTVLYTREFILSLRDTICHLRRSTRKTLFIYMLWCPGFARRVRNFGTDLEPSRPSASCPPPSAPPSSPSAPSSSPSEPPSPPSTSDSSNIRLATWNIYSLRNKYLAVADTVLESSIDILVLTESWHRSSSDVAVRRSAPPGYSVVDPPRPELVNEKSYGGIVILHRDALKTRRIQFASTPTTFEALAISVSSPRGPLTIVAVYSPGSATPSTTFFSEFASLLEQFALYNTQLVLAGDLNLYIEDPLLPEASDFRDFLDQFGLAQHVAESTHLSGAGWMSSSRVMTAL